MERELTQWRVFFFVKRSPVNSWPKWALQLAHWISVLIPSGSGTLFKELGNSLSKEGQPQPELNLASDEKRGALHLRQIKTPSSKKSSYSPEKGASVPLSTIISSSFKVSLLYAIVLVYYFK